MERRRIFDSRKPGSKTRLRKLSPRPQAKRGSASAVIASRRHCERSEATHRRARLSITDHTCSIGRLPRQLACLNKQDHSLPAAGVILTRRPEGDRQVVRICEAVPPIATRAADRSGRRTGRRLLPRRASPGEGSNKIFRRNFACNSLKDLDSRSEREGKGRIFRSSCERFLDALRTRLGNSNPAYTKASAATRLEKAPQKFEMIDSAPENGMASQASDPQDVARGRAAPILPPISPQIAAPRPQNSRPGGPA
jgi:hypothetical protein